MPYVRTLEGFYPTPRYDDIPWDRARIQESETSDGPWTTLETQDLSPIDADPSAPAVRNFTTTLATLEEGWYRIVFLDEDDNTDESNPISSRGLGADQYPTTATLVAESSVDALTDLTEAEQEALRLAAIYSIEEFTGQTFTFAEDETRQIDGSGNRRIYLPWRLQNLDELEVEGTALTDTDVFLSSDHDYIEVLADAGRSTYYERAMHALEGSPPFLFTEGEGTVTITGDWGWDTIPEAIVTAIRLDMEDQALADTNTLEQTLRAFRRMGLRDVSQGNLRATVLGANGLSYKVMTLLRPFMWQGPVGRIL